MLQNDDSKEVMSVREYITRSLVKTYFLKPVNSKDRPALAKGQQNEPFIRAAIAEHV